jgi:tripartite-type tricarboxylate transporter receptor subunit TctC
MKLVRLAAAGTLALAACLGFAQPGAYPDKPIHIVVPFPPGAGTDAVARIIAQKLAESMPAPVVVDNRPGASGAIGAAEVARADPDGHTLLFVASPFTTVAAVMTNPGYDPHRNFVSVAPIAVGPLVFVVGDKLPAKTMREFVALAKAQPGKLNYGSAGTGGVNHLALEMLKARAGVDIVHVPYKGIAPATVDLLGGQIQAITASIPAALPYLKENRLRALAVTGPTRSRLLPDVPTWRESGIADADVINYWGLVAPAGTPREIVQRLNAEVVRILAKSDVRERLEREGSEVVSGPPERLNEIVDTDLSRWKKLMTETKVRFD